MALVMFSPGDLRAQWDLAPQVAATIESWRTEWGVPGVAIAVVRGEEVLLLRGFGVRQLGRGEEVDAGTAFELGSASKTFTATLVALAVEDGIMSWTTPLVDLIPELRLGNAWLEREITVLDALAHRTGFARNDLLWLGGATTGDILRRVRYAEPTGGFRHEFGYSNLMYILVGEALARVSGRSWETLLGDRITNVLEMSGTGTEGAVLRGNVASPHVRLGDSILVAATPRTHVGPAGGIMTNARDLGRWMSFQLGGKGALLEMRRPWTPLPLEAFGPQYARASSLGYGAGWFVSDYAGRLMVDHIGGHGGMVANVTLIPEEKIGVAVLTNEGDNVLPVAATYHVLDLLLGLEPRPWNQTLIEFWQQVRQMRAAAGAAPGGSQKQDAPPRLGLDAYAGRYTSPLYGDVHVEFGDEGLNVRYGATLVGRLTHWHYDTFSVRWSDPMLRGILGTGWLSFDLDMSGRASGLSLTGFQGELLEAKRAIADGL